MVAVDAEGNEVGRPWLAPDVLLRSQTKLMSQLQKQQATARVERPAKLDKIEAQHIQDFVRERLAPSFDVRAQAVLVNGKQLDEAGFEKLHLDLAEQGFSVKKADLQAATRALALDAAFDPVVIYLNSVSVNPALALTDKEWMNIHSLSLGIEGEFEGEILRKFLISAVARAMEPGCKVDQALVLYGPQGSGKSSFFRALAGEWFTDSLGDDPGDKDEVFKLLGAWIAEWSELDRVFGGAGRAEKVKRFVSSQEDRCRRAYGRTTEALPRQSVLVGTTNRKDWASDHTGNRRYPVLAPTAIDIDWVEKNRDRILARAVVEWRKGTPWWFSAEQEEQISQIAREYAPEDEWANPLIDFFERHPGEPFTTREVGILALSLDRETLDRRTLHRIGRSIEACASPWVARVMLRNHTPQTHDCGSKGTHSVWIASESKEKREACL
jgi:predicted P-loop ATPase